MISKAIVASTCYDISRCLYDTAAKNSSSTDSLHFLCALQFSTVHMIIYLYICNLLIRLTPAASKIFALLGDNPYV